MIPWRGAFHEDSFLPHFGMSLLDRCNLYMHHLHWLGLLSCLFNRCFDQRLLLSSSVTISPKLRFDDLLSKRRFALDSHHNSKRGFFLDRWRLRIITAGVATVFLFLETREASSSSASPTGSSISISSEASKAGGYKSGTCVITTASSIDRATM